MQPSWIVEAMDVAGDGRVCIGLGGIHAGDFLVLERSKEALRHGVVPAVAFAAYARHNAVRAHPRRCRYSWKPETDTSSVRHSCLTE
jgi:hypothetical protein